MSIEVGTTFKTGNSVVRNLEVGTLLQVIGAGKLEVLGEADTLELEQEASPLLPGDRFTSKYGPATVVGLSSRFSQDLGGEFDPEDQVLYIADGTNKVRITERYQ